MRERSNIALVLPYQGHSLSDVDAITCYWSINLKMPVLLLIGDREILYDAGAAIDRARRLIPHVEAEIIPDAGHMLSTDQPEMVIGRMLQFLQGANRMPVA